MKKLLRWIFIQLIYVLILIAFISNSYSQVLWGMTSDGGSKKYGGNIFSINGDGSGFTERYAFFNDAEATPVEHLCYYGDGYFYGIARQILFRCHNDGSGYEILYTFQEATGNFPSSSVIKGQDGFLYGVTVDGGTYGAGVVYKVKRNGSSYQVLHHFNGDDGSRPESKLLQLNDGFMYGTTAGGGGSGGWGTIYRIALDGTGFQTLYTFTSGFGNSPAGSLLAFGINNKMYLYGVTPMGGANDLGSIYRIETSGANFSVQYDFGFLSGQTPTGSLIKIGNKLYGAALWGGITNGGVVFSFEPTTHTYNILHQFVEDPSDIKEFNPLGPLLNVNNELYGTTAEGGSFSKGVLYKINNDGTGYQVIHDFEEDNAVTTKGNLVFVNNQIYGTVQEYLVNYSNQGKIFSINTDGSSYQIIHAFEDKNGYSPFGKLTLGQDGKLYGLAAYGGGSYSGGVAFSIESTGSNYTALAEMANQYENGNPEGSLIQASNGNFYGMRSGAGNWLMGQVFMMSLSPTPTLTYYDVFCFNVGCISRPVASLLQASDGNLYGMAPGYSDGGVFKIAMDGTGYTVLKLFSGTDGSAPAGSLIQTANGYLYGMTENGGTNDYGTIFKIKTDGTGFQTIFQFGTYTSAYYGSHPKGTLLLGSDGKLYGMCSSGGTFGGGTMFQINANGTGITRLIDFNSVNGWAPVSSLVEDVPTGFLFGMTEQGGTSNLGLIYKVKKDGTSYQTLLNFDGSNGKYPKGDLLILQPGVPSPQPNPIVSSHEENRRVTNISISIFPNPVKQSFTIRFQRQFSGRVNYTISDLSGRELIKKTIDRSAISEIKSVDISSLPAGTYLLELSTPSEKFTQKILKR